jgi:hypothetical protein
MTSSRILSSLVVTAVLAGCGNYSNEDLEFMNALPEQELLQVEIPRSAILPANEAELARMTHQATQTFNGLLGSLVGMVDWIRSHEPTSRTRDSRTWGPYDADRAKDRNPDWQTRMIVRRDLVEPNQFNYEIAVHENGTADTLWYAFIRGSFHTSETARRGTGYVELVTADVRAAGMDVTNLENLDRVRIDYDTVAVDAPISIKMTWVALPDPLSQAPAPMIVYQYKATLDGQGQMTFDLYGNFILVSDAQEHMNVTTRWLPSGAGRGTLTVVSGDLAGLVQQECWDRSFRSTFNQKPWAPAEQVAGDPSNPDICPVIPDL